MNKKIPHEKVASKVRFSASTESWIIADVKTEARKEERSFSDMVGRLLNEALKKRNPVKK